MDLSATPVAGVMTRAPLLSVRLDADATDALAVMMEQQVLWYDGKSAVRKKIVLI